MREVRSFDWDWDGWLWLFLGVVIFLIAFGLLFFSGNIDEIFRRSNSDCGLWSGTGPQPWPSDHYCYLEP